MSWNHIHSETLLTTLTRSATTYIQERGELWKMLFELGLHCKFKGIWEIYTYTIGNVDTITLAACTLHNYLRTRRLWTADSELYNDGTRRAVADNALGNIEARATGQNYSQVVADRCSWMAELQDLKCIIIRWHDTKIRFVFYSIYIVYNYSLCTF